MDDLSKIIFYSSLSGITVFLGGLFSKLFEVYFRQGFVKQEIIHTSIAFGGGIIIAAVAFVLVPKGMEVMPLVPMTVLFISGAIIFFFLDRYIEKKGGTISQFNILFKYTREMQTLRGNLQCVLPLSYCFYYQFLLVTNPLKNLH